MDLNTPSKRITLCQMCCECYSNCCTCKCNDRCYRMKGIYKDRIWSTVVLICGLTLFVSLLILSKPEYDDCETFKSNCYTQYCDYNKCAECLGSNSVCDSKCDTFYNGTITFKSNQTLCEMYQPCDNSVKCDFCLRQYVEKGCVEATQLYNGLGMIIAMCTGFYLLTNLFFCTLKESEFK